MRALLWKEWREMQSAILVLLFLVAVVIAIANSMGILGATALERWPQWGLILMATSLVAAGVGARAHSSEFTGRHNLLLLTSPLSRVTIWVFKALWGLAWLVVAWMAPLALSLWVSVQLGAGPGDEASMADAWRLLSGFLWAWALTPYLAAFVISGMGYPGLNAWFLSLVGAACVAMACAIVWALLSAIWQGPFCGLSGAWLPTTLLIPAVLVGAGLYGYARTPGNDAPRRTWRTLGAGVVLLVAVSAVNTAQFALRHPRLPTEPADSIEEVTVSTDGTRLTFEAGVRIGRSSHKGWWTARTDGTGVQCIATGLGGLTYCRWAPQLDAYVVRIAGAPAGGQRISLWLMGSDGVGRRLSTSKLESRRQISSRFLQLAVPEDGSVVAVGGQRFGVWAQHHPTPDTLTFVRLKPGAWLPSDLSPDARKGFLGWSGDGQSIHYADSLAESTRVVRLSRDGEEQEVARIPAAGCFTRAYEAQRMVVFSGGPAGAAWVVDLDAGKAVTIKGSSRVGAEALAPNGRFIAYIEVILGVGTRTQRLRIHDCKSGAAVADAPVPWAGEPTTAGSPNRGLRWPTVTLAWSPDSTLLAAVVWTDDDDDGATTGITILDARGNEVARLAGASVTGQTRFAGWTADNELVLVEKEKRVFRLDPMTGRETGTILMLEDVES